MRKVLIILTAVILFAAAYFIYNSRPDEKVNVTGTETTVEETEDQKEPVEEEPQYDFETASSLQVLVNRDNPLPQNYAPALTLPDVPLHPDKSEAELSVDQRIEVPLEDLFEAAKLASVNIMLASAYRSYDLQAFYYNNYVQTYGQAEADKFSARPGTSEHQTGLAVDFARPDRYCYLEQCFQDTDEGKWLKNNAYKFGFILRYPEGESNITGYSFEPWHFRYVGKAIAAQIYQSDLVYEEFVQNSRGE